MVLEAILEAFASMLCIVGTVAVGAAIIALAIGVYDLSQMFREAWRVLRRKHG